MKDDISAGIYTDIFFGIIRKISSTRNLKKGQGMHSLDVDFLGGGEIQIGSPHPPKKNSPKKSLIAFKFRTLL